MKEGFWKLRVTAETAHMANPVSQPSLDISPLISDEVSKSKRSLWRDTFFPRLIRLSLPHSIATQQMALAIGTYLVSLTFHFCTWVLGTCIVG
jgi:hypothetical protein